MHVVNMPCSMITKFVREYTSAIDYKRDEHKNTTIWVIRECLKNRYITPSRSFKPKDIIEYVRHKFGV